MNLSLSGLLSDFERRTKDFSQIPRRDLRLTIELLLYLNDEINSSISFRIKLISSVKIRFPRGILAVGLFNHSISDPGTLQIQCSKGTKIEVPTLV